MMHTPRRLLVAFGVMWCTTALGAAGPDRPAPNLLVFLADDLGARDLRCAGSSFYRTPAIDALAASGMMFTRGYAACPVCSPTRAALVTGRHSARVRITNSIAGDRRGRLLGADYLKALPVPMHSVHVPLITRPELVAEEGRRAGGVGPRFDIPAVPAGDPFTRGVQDHPVYSGMIREMDETVATVLEAVERAGQTANTLVIFTSDNGGLATAEGAPTSNLPLRAGKGFVYEGGIRVPLIVQVRRSRNMPGYSRLFRIALSTFTPAA